MSCQNCSGKRSHVVERALDPLAYRVRFSQRPGRKQDTKILNVSGSPPLSVIFPSVESIRFVAMSVSLVSSVGVILSVSCADRSKCLLNGFSFGLGEIIAA